MDMPKDTKGTAPEDVQAHRFSGGNDESQATEQRDSGQDVSAHGNRIPDTSGDDVDTPGGRLPDTSGEDVEGHARRI